MAKRVITKALGLYSHPNQLSLPEGALVQADNVLISRENVIEPRRGASAYATHAANRLFPYKDVLVSHSSSATISYDNGSGTFTANSGSYNPPDVSEGKTRAAEASGNLFFTTSLGVYRKVSASGTPAWSGAVKAVGFERNDRVYSSTAGNMSLTANVVTVTTTAAHGFYVGQVITQTSATEAPYAAGNYTVATVPSSTSFTYALVAGDDPANANTHTFAPASLVTAGGFLTDGNQVAYRVVFNCADTNNVEKPGAASPRTVVSNASGTPGWVTTEAKNVVLRAFVPSGITTSHSVRLYRSKQVSTSIEPDDELQLVYEAFCRSLDISRGWVDIADVTPDALRGETLYIAPSQEGEENQNERPPSSRDLANFGGAMHYARTTSLHRLVVNLLAVGSPNGLQAGDSIYVTYGGSAYVAQTAPTSSTHFKLETSGTAAQNIRNTALNLCAAVNRNASEACWALYISSGTEAPGRILLEGRVHGSSASQPLVSGTSATSGRRAAWAPVLSHADFTADLSRTSNVVTGTIVAGGIHNLIVGDSISLSNASGTFGSGPHVITAVNAAMTTFTYSETAANDTATNKLFTSSVPVVSSAEIKPNRVYESKVGLPEAVPLLNYEDLGSADAELLRIIPLRSSLFAFKEDGIWRKPLGGTWGLFDPTVILLAPDSAATLGNMIYALTNQGVVAVSDTGIEIVSRQIERSLTALQAVNLTKLKQMTFGVGYESERRYYLWTITATGDARPTQAWVYNTVTRTWTKDTRTASHGMVNPVDDKLYLAGATQVLKERKDYAYTDYSDADIAVFVNSTSGLTITLASATGVSAGDIITNGSEHARIIGVDSNVLTVDSTDGFNTGAATVKTGYACTVKWAPFAGTEPAALKLFAQVVYLFGNAHLPTASASWSTDWNLVETVTSVDIATIAGQWTSGQATWGGTEKPWNLRLLIPDTLRRATRFNFKLSMTQAWSVWNLSGFAVLFSGGSNRVSK